MRVGSGPSRPLVLTPFRAVPYIPGLAGTSRARKSFWAGVPITGRMSILDVPALTAAE